MREIKFRFWSKILHKFVTPDDSIYSGVFKDPEMVILQYTGLKDKYGMEIYEGDVIEFTYLSKDKELQALSTGRGQIVFKWGQWVIEHIFGATPSRGTLWKLLDDMETESGEDWGDAIYVIGNIYENSELLEEEGSQK